MTWAPTYNDPRGPTLNNWDPERSINLDQKLSFLGQKAQLLHTWKIQEWPYQWVTWVFPLYIYTPPKINIEPENDGLEDDFPLPVVYSQVPC